MSTSRDGPVMPPLLAVDRGEAPGGPPRLIAAAGCREEGTQHKYRLTVRSRREQSAAEAVVAIDGRSSEVPLYGRVDTAWDELTDAGLGFLIERAQLRMTTSYTEFNAVLVRRTGLRGFDFDRADERAAVGYLLGRIVDRNYPTTGLMISALVQHLDANDAGGGFYALAADKNMLPRGASADTRQEFLDRPGQPAVRVLRSRTATAQFIQPAGPPPSVTCNSSHPIIGTSWLRLRSTRG